MFHPVAKPPEDSFEIVFVGRISARKGIKDLLDGFNKANIPNKKLTLVGTLDQEIKELFDKELSADNIELKGHVSQPELKNLLSRSHVFCLPSIEDGFGMAVGEAMACACPVIVTANAGGASIVNEGENGYIIPIRSPEKLAEKLERLAFNPSLRDQMGQNALSSVKKLGGWEQYGQQMISVYKAALSNRQ
jgi:glycosyltransferase involved in cell wall biosynthesis